jgi:hypothetical protein
MADAGGGQRRRQLVRTRCGRDGRASCGAGTAFGAEVGSWARRLAGAMPSLRTDGVADGAESRKHRANPARQLAVPWRMRWQGPAGRACSRCERPVAGGAPARCPAAEIASRLPATAGHPRSPGSQAPAHMDRHGGTRSNGHSQAIIPGSAWTG